MIIAVDFDGVIVAQDHDYADLRSPLRFLPGAREGLHALVRAGHVLVLYSARANRALRVDPNLNPLVKAGAVKVSREQWAKSRALNEARYQQMLAFVARELPGVFAAVDDGQQGKPCAGLFIDDRALRFGSGCDWRRIAHEYGAQRSTQGRSAVGGSR